MVSDITPQDFTATPSTSFGDEEAALTAAHAQALSELTRLREQASIDDSTTSTTADYSMHEVSAVGRYVIPRRSGWKPLLKIIHDPVPNIDFSANIYPAFDGILGDHFQSPYLLDPLDDHYESYESLRDNLAAVRNFLMECYYAKTPSGMTPAAARNALAEIAGFVGDGLYNNWLYLGIIPNHNPTQPFIDISKARKPNGEGAQYIYEKILEHQRHSNSMRPFSAVVAMFGGQPIPDWKLPAASTTPFNDLVGKDIVGEFKASSVSVAVAAAAAKVAEIEARLANLKDARALTHVATDLDTLGNHLIYTVQNMQGVAHIAKPVRDEAVACAHKILRGLKDWLGNKPVMDALKMKPTDDMDALAAIKGVAMVYERLLAWARGNNDTSIFQHPAIIEATQAIGQLGYLAKLEALRMAKAAGNSVMASNIGEQIKRLPEGYTKISDTRFGSLLAKVEQGIDTVINRTQQVSVNGAKVGFSVDSSMGNSLSNAPTAGSANQVSSSANNAQRTAQALAAEQMAAQAQAQRTHGQLASQARAQQQQQSQQQQAQATQPRGASVGRQATARTQPARPATIAATSTSAPVAPITPAQQQQALRSATVAATAQAARERDEQLAREQQQSLQRATQTDAARRAAQVAAKMNTDMLKGIQSATNTKGLAGTPILPGRRVDPANVMKPVPKAPATPAPLPSVATPITSSAIGTPEENKLLPPTPTPPTRGGGRSF
jgi:hypothetical protein